MAKLAPQKHTFKDAETYKRWLGRIECFAIISSIIGTFLSFLPKYSDECKQGFEIISLILIVGIFYLQQEFEITYKNAESTRRDGLIDSSYNTAIADIQSEDYYDTERIEIGFRKLLANMHENSFFSSRIIYSMFKCEGRKTIIAFLILIITAIVSSVTSQTFIAILQAFLSMNFIGSYFKLRNLKNELDLVQSKCKAIWENLKHNDRKSINPNQQALIIREVIRYETALSSASMMFDEDLYNQINPKATAEWEAMRSRYNM